MLEVSEETAPSILYMLGGIDAKLNSLITIASAHDKRLQSTERKLYVGSGGIAVACAFIVPKLRAVLGL